MNCLAEANQLLLFEGKFFEQYDIRWGGKMRYVVPICNVADRRDYLRAACHYRLVFREVSSSTNERTLIAAFLPPNSLTAHTAPVDETPWERPSSLALIRAC